MARSGHIGLLVWRRLLQAVPLLVGVIVVNFLITHLAPGDPVQVLLGDIPAPPEYVYELRQQFGLDKPLYAQLIIYFKEVLQGNLGYSFYYRQPVLTIISERVVATIYLMVSAYILSAIFGIAFGIFSARRVYSLQDNLISVVSLFCYSVPVFWLGQMMLILFSI